MAQFWTKAAVVNNCVLIDNKVAIPEQLATECRSDSPSPVASWTGGYYGCVRIHLVAVPQSSDS